MNTNNCINCEHKYSTKGSLTRHYKKYRTINEDKTVSFKCIKKNIIFNCEICKKVFSTKQSLQRHLSLIKKVNKQYNKSFKCITEYREFKLNNKESEYLEKKTKDS